MLLPTLLWACGGLVGSVVLLLSYMVGVLLRTQLRWWTWLRNVPGPPRTSWCLGNLPAFLRHNAMPVCRAWATKYGGAVRYWAMFGVRIR